MVDPLFNDPWFNKRVEDLKNFHGNKKVLFIHIPKCAGTNVKRWLYFHDIHHLISEVARHVHNDKVFRSEILHWTARRWTEILGKTSYVFTIVRNPFDRLVSLFRYRKYLQPEDSKLKLSMDIPFEEWIENIEKYETESWDAGNKQSVFAYNQQIEWINDIDGNSIVDEVFKFEELPKNLRNVKKFLPKGYTAFEEHKGYNRWGVPVESKVNETYSFENKDYRSYYNKKTKDIVTEWYKDDLKTFDYEF